MSNEYINESIEEYIEANHYSCVECGLVLTTGNRCPHCGEYLHG